MPVGNLGYRYSDIFGVEGIYKVLIDSDRSLNIVNPTQQYKGLAIPPRMIIEIIISGLDMAEHSPRVRFQLLYEYRTSDIQPPVSWKAYDDQDNELQTSPESLPTTAGRENLVVSIEGRVSRIELFSAGTLDPNLLIICFYP